MRPRLLLIIAAMAAIAALAAWLLSSGGGGGEDRPDYPYDVQTFEDLGRDHLAPDQTYEMYNSEPPTTGPHSPAPAPWGVSDTTLAREVPVHNMEHGGVVIWYNCAAGDLDEAACRELRDGLADITVAKGAEGKQVLMLPYADMDVLIALTAWSKLDTLDELDAERVALFIDAFDRLFNPENF